MNFKQLAEMKWVAGRSSLVLVFHDRSVDAVRLDQSLLGPTVRLMERFVRDGQTPERIAAKLRETGNMPARVLVCLPRPMVIQRTLLYPLAVQNDLDQMLEFEAARHVPLPEADRSLAYIAVPLSDGKQMGVGLLAARRSDVAAFIAPLTAAGIPVDEVTLLSALLTPAADGVPEFRVLADEDHMELVLFAGGLMRDSLLMERPSGGFSKESLVDAARRMSVRHRDLLGAEGIGRIISAGEPLPDDLQGGLETAFGLHVRPLEIPETLRAAVEESAAEPVLTGALCAAAADPQPSLNLIDRTGRKVTLSPRTWAIAGLCALLAAELLLGWLVRTVSPAIALKSVEKDIAELKRAAAPVQTVHNQNRDLRNELDQLNELGKTRVSIMGLMKVLSDTLPDDTYLQAVNYTRDEDLRLRGRSKAPDQLPHLVQGIPFVATIEESDIGEKTDEYYGFSLSAALRSVRDE